MRHIFYFVIKTPVSFALKAFYLMYTAQLKLEGIFLNTFALLYMNF